MKRDRYHAELCRLPQEQLVNMVIHLRERQEKLEKITRATALVREIFPPAYINALATLYDLAHSNPAHLTNTGRPIHQSKTPIYNPAAAELLKQEQRKLEDRVPFLLNATERAQRYPYGNATRRKAS